MQAHEEKTHSMDLGMNPDHPFGSSVSWPAECLTTQPTYHYYHKLEEHFHALKYRDRLNYTRSRMDKPKEQVTALKLSDNVQTTFYLYLLSLVSSLIVISLEMNLIGKAYYCTVRVYKMFLKSFSKRS